MENWRKFVLKENAGDWYDSEDNDYPAASPPEYASGLQSKEVISLKKGDVYKKEGNTHGLTSHNIKHLMEINQDVVYTHINAAIEHIKDEGMPVYKSEANGASTTKEINPDQITRGQVLNMFDLINDKMFQGPNLSPEEETIFKNFIEPMNKVYHNQILFTIVRKAQDISDKKVDSYDDLKKILEERPTVKVKGTYSGRDNTYYVNTQNSVVVSQLQSGKYATLFKSVKRKDDKISLQQAIKQFGTNKGSQATDEYSLFRQYVDQLNAAVQPQPKKKKKQQNNQGKLSVMDFAMEKLKIGLPEEKVVEIIMKAHNKPEHAAKGIVAGAKKRMKTQEGQ